jgi:hypothetical protein
LEFIKDTKNPERNFRFKILDVLWKNMYADCVLDVYYVYESTLMKRLSELIHMSDE